MKVINSLVKTQQKSKRHMQFLTSALNLWGSADPQHGFPGPLPQPDRKVF